MYEETKTQHPHGNHEAKPSHGVHVGKEGHKGGSGAKARDPGGFTSSMTHGGNFPGGPSGAGEANPSPGYGPGR